ncbi:LOW QUALITY PROTEIN: thioester-containing protein 1 allele R1-like [Topomyia yanbarensis]|uniref:LOW QUALITY PROTEIN: thioester-containing protein 1 allele R1-like n=1 Tax=Topomyia yanbarensis TaxID=2498891 RepID=UPI00273BD417|nr:LOW QUALITY PROTEIN: thioester-containing protein 1 allele R1-like [Topomyia yanbarensis]
MKRRLRVVCIVLAIIFAVPVFGAGNYMILAPGNIQQSQPYQLSISTFALDDPPKLAISIEGFSEHDEEITVEQQIQLQSDETRLMELNTTALQPGAYNLKIRSLSGFNINQDHPLQFQGATGLILVQTDKPIYRPGNTVKFRVLVLDERMRPLDKLQRIHVTVYDPEENVILVWPSAKLQRGVFQSQLEIANEPNLGNWSIGVSVPGKDHLQSFLVDEYKLPKHEIRIMSSKVSTLNDEAFTVDIDARYLFGKPMKGDVTVSAQTGHRKLNITSRIHGLLRVRFDIRELIDSAEKDSNAWIQVDVSLKERHTKRILNATKSFQIFKSYYEISMQKSSKYLSYKCWLKIRSQTGTKLTNQPDQLAAISIVYVGQNHFNHTEDFTVNTSNESPISLDFFVPIQATRAEIDVSFNGSKGYFSLEKNPINTPETYQISLLTSGPAMLEQNVPVLVQSSTPLNSLIFYVVSKHRIIQVQRLSPNGEMDVTLTIPVTAAMIPKARISVFSIQNNTILSDSITLDVSGLPNTVALTLSEQRVAPGQRVKLTIQSRPNSMVGLSAVDKSALLLESGALLTKDMVFKELEHEATDKDSAAQTDDIIVASNAHQPLTLSARFGNYDADEEDSYIPPRKVFTESWLWHDMLEVGADGTLTLWDHVPDTITNWKITAFALSPEHGLAVLDQPISLEVTKPFFIMLNLPRSIKKSEIAVIEVSLFSYLDETLYVGVTLKNSRQEYEFVDNRGRKDASYQVKNVVLTPNSVTATKFFIKPKKLGDIMIKVIAESTEASDSVERLLRITPESLPYFKKAKRYIQVENSTQIFNKIELEIPRYLDAGSENISLSVHGNLLGNAADNLDDQIRLPSGSGEQNVLKMVPSVVLLDYITNTRAFNDVVKKRAVKFLETGYQNELKFKRPDGSFSMFGKEDRVGSVFLTALVAKTLQQASRYVTIDGRVIEQAYGWLQQKQSSHGSFVELGTEHNQELSVIHSDEVRLTAYVLIAFLEDPQISLKYKSVIDSGTEYLSKKYFGLNSSYTLSLIAYALQLADHSAKLDALNELLKNSVVDHERQLRWWDVPYMRIETAAYALLTYVSAGSYVDPRPLMNWLTTKQYYIGNLENTQTTFVGLQALAEYAKKVSTSRNDYDVTVGSGSRNHATIHIDPLTSLTVQKISLPSNVRVIDVTINGTGTGIFELEYSYYSNILKMKPRFDVTVETLNTTSDQYLDLTVCARFKPREKYEETSLVLMEVTFPSGYIALDESVEELEASTIVQKVATRHGETSLLLYFDSLPVHYQCLNVTGFRESEVLQQIPGTLRVYDFYDNSRIAIAYFDGK